MAVRRFVVESGEDSRTVEIDTDGRVTIGGGGKSFEIQQIGASGEYDVRDGLHRVRVFVAGPAEAREVFIDGRVLRFEVTPAEERRRKHGASHGDALAAPMPGTVVKVLVQPGQQVQRGEVLIKLEAMKMELPVRAPHDGTVKAVHCKEGELVQAGVRLLDLS